ncbi:conserved hypothetical protein [Candidatus Magnetomoraceae bacterium gMMP-1]
MNKSNIQSLQDEYLDIKISQDVLKAYLCIKKKLSPELSYNDIKNLLDKQGIKYGIVNDEVIDNYLNDEKLHQKPLQIAIGKAPQPTKHSEIKYYFTTDPSKLIDLESDKAVDFKKRAEIPMVSAGDLLAEKIPGKKGEPGINIFGEPIKTEKLMDIKIKCGKGAELASDKTKVFAKISGKPQASAAFVDVLAELTISGNVDMKTGNVKFDGLVNVRGEVENGFKVHAGSLTAQAIMKAEIETSGDIIVSGGIIGSKIKSGGSVQAGFIKAASIEAADDIITQREIIDSKIESGGKCTVQKGKILSSHIFACKGISSVEIGSPSSPACNLTIGTNSAAINKIRILKETLLDKNESLPPVPELKNQLKEIDHKIKGLLKAKIQAEGLKIDLHKKIKQLKQSPHKSELRKIKITMKAIDSKIKVAEENLKQLLEKRNQAINKINKHSDEFDIKNKEIQKINEEIQILSEKLQDEKGKFQVSVSGEIFRGTTIIGPNSAIILKEDFSQVLIKEVIVPSGEGTESKMLIRPLKNESKK